MFKQLLTFFTKGFAIGSADLVPGISGATIALVLNVYQPFISNIKRLLSIESLQLITKGEWRKFSNFVHLKFLISLVAGIFTCIFTMASLIAYLLEYQPISFWSFFFGLVITCAVVLPNYSERFHISKPILVILGSVSGYLLTSFHSLNTPDTPWMTFIAGMISIGAMLLPGISGSFLLVLIGKYTSLIHAIKNIEIKFLSIFFLGAVISIIVLPRIITLIFKNGKEWFILFICGFLIGSVKKIWPWQLVEPVTGEKVAVFPSYYQKILNQDPQWLSAIIFCLLGVCLIFTIQYLENYFNKSTLT